MNVLTLLILAALTLTDPTGDAIGDGTLVAPSSPNYANPAVLDLHELQVERLGGNGGTAPAEVRLTIGEIRLDPNMPNGWAGAVFDVYIDTGEGGIEATLSGPDMLMPPNSGWEYAIRLGPDYAYAVRHDDVVAEADSEADTGPLAQPGSVERLHDGTLLRRVPVTVTVDGNSLRLMLPWDLPQRYFAYAVSGVHDSFSASGWRQLAQTQSPWAFSGGQQRVPVIDLLADSHSEQVRALREGVLPRVGGGAAQGWPWLVMMGSGVALALVGMWQRRRSPAPALWPPAVGPPAFRPLAKGASAATRGREEPLRTGLPPLPEDPQVEADDPPGTETPAPTGTAPEDLVPEEPVPIEPVPIEPVPVEPVPVEPVPEDPVPGSGESEVAVSEEAAPDAPVISEPEPIEPSPTEPEPPTPSPRAVLALPRPDPFERLGAESEVDAADSEAPDPIDGARLWGRRAAPSELRIDGAAGTSEPSEPREPSEPSEPEVDTSESERSEDDAT